MNNRGPRDPANLIEGKVEILAYEKGVLFDHQVLKNILLYQGLGQVISAISSSYPPKPRIVARMAIGDQGTIPADLTVPRVPQKNLTSLYHEIYRKDIDSTVPTIYSLNGLNIVGTTTLGSSTITGMATTVGISAGMVVTGTGVPLGTVVVNILGANSIQVSNLAISSNTGITLNFAGAANQCVFVATFAAAAIDISAFSDPAKPYVNEVGLVILDPTAPDGLGRSPVTSPATPPSDEVLLSIRTFKSVPFVAANDITLTVRYTLYTE